MIGKRISATIWQVDYSYTNSEPPRLIHLATCEPEKPKTIAGQRLLTTADPTGCDLCDVARSVVCGAQAAAVKDFTITHAHRIADIKGLALVDSEGAS